MLTDRLSAAVIVAHDGAPIQPHYAWTRWSTDPTVLVVLALAGLLYARGWRARDGRRRVSAFWGGWTAIVVALVSPVDSVAAALVSAHMVQHVLLVAVAAPLLAAAAPGAALLRGLPPAIGHRIARLGAGFVRLPRLAWLRWVVFVATFWAWHASVLYGAAVESRWVHAAEHATFFGTAFLLWTVLVGPRRARLERGASVIVVFLVGLQSVLLATLLTFARSPWYEAYARPAPGWGLDPLADQQLAGVVMWVPSGLILTLTAIVLVVMWLRELDEHDRRHSPDDAKRRPRARLGGNAGREDGEPAAATRR